MSNHHARARARERRTRKFVLILVGALIVLAIIVHPLYERFLHQRLDDSWPSVNGTLLETRIVVVGNEAHAYHPGEIDYRVEAHVAYDMNGVHHDAWLPASNTASDRTFLAFWLSLKKSKLAVIYWNPTNPSYIQAVLD